MSGGYQYVNEMRFAAKRTPGAPGVRAGKMDRWSTRDVLGEALRWDGGTHLRHFANRGMTPEAPIIVGGMTDPDEIRAWHDNLVTTALAPGDARPRMMTARGEERQRSNSPVMISLVAGYPQPGLKSEEQLMDMPLEDRQRYMHELIAKRKSETLESAHFKAWRDATLAWAKRRYKGLVLRLAVVHYDESHIHMHIVFTDAACRSVKSHSLRAAEDGLPPGATDKEKQAAVKQAGVAMQDSYHAEVAAALGIGRISPTPRGRLSSAERKAIKARERAKADADALMQRADEDARRLREAAEREVEAARRTALERARRDTEAAYAQAEADLARRREEQLAQLDGELQALREAEKTRMVAEIREQAGEALARVHAREKSWADLIEEAIPDRREREQMLARFGLAKTGSHIG